MSWQDIVITIVSIFFFISLIPQIQHGFKEKVGPIKYQTSVPTFLGGFVNSFVFWTLNLYFSSIMSALLGGMWLILFIQRRIYHKKEYGN